MKITIKKECVNNRVNLSYNIDGVEYEETEASDITTGLDNINLSRATSVFSQGKGKGIYILGGYVVEMEEGPYTGDMPLAELRDEAMRRITNVRKWIKECRENDNRRSGEITFEIENPDTKGGK